MDYPFVFLFVAAIMGSAWFGGRIAGFLAVVFSSFLVTYFFIPPFYSISVARESESFLAAFILFALTMSILSSSRKRSESEVRKARDLLEVMVQDRTAELERSNREIVQNEHQLRLLTEAIPQQIWRADPSGSIEYVNQNLREYLGASEDALNGDHLFDSIHPLDVSLFKSNWRQVLNRGDVLEVQARVRSAANDYRWFLIRAFPQRSESGQIARWYGLHIDIEERQREQQTLTARQQMLSRLSQSLGMSEVAASIAHELNQPMTALVTHAYACREWANSSPPNLERVTATADKIIQEGTRASAVVKRIRSLFSKDELVRVPSDISVLIEDAAHLLRDELIRAGVQMDLRLSPGLPLIESDPVQIQQVVINLCKNAIEAMSNAAGERIITISTESYGANEISIQVKDTGPGISEELMPHIFEPFFSTKKSGTGIGLAICRSIVEAHSGRIAASNQACGGAVFQFNLPVHA